jgi:5-methylcytosine-specific restriction endonuclease McrA
MKLSNNIKLLPNIDIYLIHKYHNIKNDSQFIKTYDLIIEVLNHKNLEEINKIIDFDDLIKYLKDKNNYNEIYELFIDFNKLNKDEIKLNKDDKKLNKDDKKIIKDDKKLIKDEIKIINKEKKIVYKKKKISATLKRLVWYKWIGEEIGKSKCLCCNITDIYQLSFNCGHIIAESKGGETNLSNLKPICQNCNSSMGSQNMDDFMKTFL